MTESSFFEDLPDDPELAFLQLERQFRDECDKQLETERQGGEHLVYADYIARVLATVKELGLQKEFETEVTDPKAVPDIEGINGLVFQNFARKVKFYRTTLEIRHGRRVKGYSIKLDAAARLTVRHHIEQIRAVFEKLEVSKDKREALLNLLIALEAEIDRDRTRLEVFGDTMMQVAGILGDTAERIDPVRKLFESIARVFWGARQDEVKQLPQSRPKQIEPPPKQIPPPREDSEDPPF